MKLPYRLLRWLSRLTVLGLLSAIVLLFTVSTPFLATAVLWGLEQIRFEVNPIAAAAHESGSLHPAQTLEPGSPQWLSSHQQSMAIDPLQHLLNEQELRRVLSSLPNRTIEALLPQDTLHHVALPNASATVDGETWHMAQAIVVLGGGLGRNHEREIVPNIFTELRLAQAILQHQATGLPIFLSGVEAPWMQEWLLAQGVEAFWLEGRSMNTCENARFSALLMLRQGGAARVELVTDAYHMPRARRLFAENGIDTVPVVAPLPGDPTPWWPDRRNLVHTRRAIHELAATVRDLWVGETNCREVP